MTMKNNQKTARAIVDSWPQWKQDFTLTRYSIPKSNKQDSGNEYASPGNNEHTVKMNNCKV